MILSVFTADLKKNFRKEPVWLLQALKKKKEKSWVILTCLTGHLMRTISETRYS